MLWPPTRRRHSVCPPGRWPPGSGYAFTGGSPLSVPPDRRRGFAAGRTSALRQATRVLPLRLPSVDLRGPLPRERMPWGAGARGMKSCQCASGGPAGGGGKGVGVSLVMRPLRCARTALHGRPEGPDLPPPEAVDALSAPGRTEGSPNAYPCPTARNKQTGHPPQLATGDHPGHPRSAGAEHAPLAGRGCQCGRDRLYLHSHTNPPTPWHAYRTPSSDRRSTRPAE